MTAADACGQLRELAFDYRAGTLDEAHMEFVARHLRECDACAEWFERADDLLTAPSHAAAELEASIDPDDLFAAITARVAGGGATERLSVPVRADAPDTGETQFFDDDGTLMFAGVLDGGSPVAEDADPGPEPSIPPRRHAPDTPPRVRYEVSSAELEPIRGNPRFAAVMALAAVLAAALAFGLARAGRGPAEPADDGGPEEIAASSGLPDLLQRAAPSRAVELRASESARWSLNESGTPTLTVESGIVVVEYLPIDDRGLTVIAPDVTFDVVGTIFYVDADRQNTELGVIVGSVEVTTDEEPRRVDAGQRYTHGRVVPIAPATRRAYEESVDVQMHEARLVALAAAAAVRGNTGDAGSDAPGPTADVRPLVPSRTPTARPTLRRPAQRPIVEPDEPGRGVDQPTNRTAVEPVTPEPTRAEDPAEDPNEAPPEADREPTAYDRATAAMADRRWQEAARHFEQALSADGADPSIRLDLARLYMRRLDSPSRAADHLRAFVGDYPNDPAAESARQQLCRIADERGTEEPLCR